MLTPEEIFDIFQNHRLSGPRDFTPVMEYIEQGGPLDISSPLGTPFMHFTVIHMQTTLLEKMIEHGAPIDSLNKFNETPLHLATQTGQYDMVAMLLLKGADAHRRNARNRRAIDLYEPNNFGNVFAMTPDELRYKRAFWTVIHDDVEGLKHLLGQEGYSPFMKNSFGEELHTTAVVEGAEAVTAFLAPFCAEKLRAMVHAGTSEPIPLPKAPLTFRDTPRRRCSPDR